LKIISWNTNRATKSSKVWEILTELDGDVLLLQEVTDIPSSFLSKYDYLTAVPRTKNGKEQRFKTTVLSKTPLLQDLNLQSKINWVNNELDFFSGNILSCTTKINNKLKINLISVYSPAWPIPDSRLEGIDISSIKLKSNPKIYCTEILWALLKDSLSGNSGSWIIAGDFNSSTTFDWMWGKKPRGNQEIIDRMNSLGFVDSLSSYERQLVPTFMNLRNKKLIHQLDYVYLDETLSRKILRSYALDNQQIFDEPISDHLPVITELKLNDL
tara:strand:+ start:154 stop:963 length:810 start_codon:yes stop_codon:yes gene_type:complete